MAPRVKAIDHIANIGPGGQQRRVRLAIMALVATALLAGLLWSRAPRGWRPYSSAPGLACWVSFRLEKRLSHARSARSRHGHMC
jgi:hypothetical protein